MTRLIDADELKKVIHSSSLSGNREWLLMDLDQIIDNAPTVEEPQGEWIEKRDVNGCIQLYCNQCGTKAQVGFISFCGKCGAKMEVKKNDTVQNTD